ncbi:hypothetical protein [Mycoplana rhizolycopersici]|jgi:hypothetical protein|uniref:Uncharacterized protein n=1 Tax=Mycoplana rhizolycopersici TaxID=2746702 RepID=A0ABX2QDG2_9HYPH|nr:hypothetical protein [Rhizobium rhizolycopersici]NVP55793.1 hypothetical protein [Rhizobium rhizolycopersici]
MDAQPRPFRLQNAGQGSKLSVSLPSRITRLVAGALAWGALMALSASISLYFRNGFETLHLAELVTLFFLGGALAWPFVVLAAGLVARNAAVETRFAACFVLLALGTIGVTALLFAMDYRVFYSEWHEPILSRIGVKQLFGTTVSASYQFAVLGMRLYLPVGLPILAGASLWLAKAMR